MSAFDADSGLHDDLMAWHDEAKPLGPGPFKIVNGGEWDRALAEAKSGPPVDEAAFAAAAADRAHKIASMLTTGEIGPGLPPGYRFEFAPVDADWFGRHGTRDGEQWFPKQVRGTAPEPTPDGFLVPFTSEDLLNAVMDAYGLPSDLFTRPVPPPTRRQRIRRTITSLRDRTARRAYRIIAGDWPDNGEDDW